MFIAFVLIGIAMIAYGIQAIKNPESDWFEFRFFEFESKDHIDIVKLIGKIIVIIGVTIIILCTQHLFV